MHTAGQQAMKIGLESSVNVDVNKQESSSGDSPKPSARMAKLLSRTRLVSYLPGLKALQQRVASVSSSHVALSYSGAEGRLAGEDVQFTVRSSSISDKDLGPLGPVNPRFPLPGNTGITNTSYVRVAHRVPDILTKALPQDRHANVLSQFVNTVAESQDDDITKQIEELRDHPEALECISQDCPENLRKEFLSLFPGISIESTDKFTVVTLCQRTRNNMTGWSNEVEEERNQLLESFIKSAKEVCEVLTEAGYWADFIDPSSGQAYLGDSNPNTSLFETDERYRSLGFEIEDLGCCKCIRHFKWGTHTFVGTIFTNAPPDSSLITTILKDKL